MARIAGMIGNLLEHYDNALFGLLAPFIAALFFQEQDPLTALILTYGMLPLGFITRPLGALCFGWIGDRFGRREALFLSLSGMALTTISMGFLPLHRDIGTWAPILLACGRMLQNFFAAGESTGGAIFVLEQTAPIKRGFISSLYDASSIAGILIASACVTLLSSLGNAEQHWRLLFWLGGIPALLGLLLRLTTKDGAEFTQSPQQIPWIQTLKENRPILLSIILASGFSYTTYSLTFTLMNGYIPLITSLSKTEVMQINTSLLVVDMLLLPCFGYLSTQFGRERIMLFGTLSSAVLAIPLFSLLSHAPLHLVILVRMTIVLFGVAFAAPYHAWAIEKVLPHQRYLLISLGGALGGQLIGVPSSAICLWLYKTSEWAAAPALYLLTTAIGATYALYLSATQKVSKTFAE